MRALIKKIETFKYANKEHEQNIRGLRSFLPALDCGNQNPPIAACRASTYVHTSTTQVITTKIAVCLGIFFDGQSNAYNTTTPTVPTNYIPVGYLCLQTTDGTYNRQELQNPTLNFDCSPNE